MANKKQFNRIGLLGLLGFMVLIWPITGQWTFAFSIGYFFFFKYLRIIPDELFKENVRSSASSGFFLTQIIMAVTMFSWALFSVVLDITNGFLILYWGNIAATSIGFIVFSIKLGSLEKKEKRDLKNIEE